MPDDQPLPSTNPRTAAPPPRMVKDTYSVRPLLTAFVFALGLTLFALSFFPLILPLIVTDSFGLSFVLPYLLILVPIGAGLIALGLWATRTSGRHLGLKVLVYADGLRIDQFGRRESIAWDEIKEVWYNPNEGFLQDQRPLYATYRLVKTDGKSRILGRFINGIDQLGLTIELETVNRLAGAALKKLEAGEEIDFGPIRFSKDGLIHKEELLPLKEISSASLIDGGALVIKYQHGWSEWFRGPMAKIPNVMLLFRLLTILGRANKDQAPDVTSPREATEPEATLWRQDVLREDEIAKLGVPIGVCGVNPRVVATSRVMGKIMLGISLFGVIILLSAFFNPPGGARNGLLIGGGIFTALFLSLGLALSIEASAYLRKNLLVFREGFVHVKGKKGRVCPWNRIPRVWQRITRNYLNGVFAGTTYNYSIERDDKARFEFDSKIANVEKFGDYLLNAVQGRLLTQALKDHRSGQTIDFGPIKLDSHAVIQGRNQLSWGDYHYLHIAGGKLFFYRKDKKEPVFSVDFALVPNSYVLLELVKQTHGGVA